MYEKCFYFLLNPSFLGKMVFLRKLKLIPPAPPNIKTIVQSPSLLILFKKFLAPLPFKIEGDYAFYMRDYKGETKKIITILYDRLFIYRTEKS